VSEPSDDDSSERPHEPSQRKLDEARRKGDTPRTPDLAAAAGTLALVIGATQFGWDALAAAGDAGRIILHQADRHAAESSIRLHATLPGPALTAIAALSLFVLLPMAGAAAAMLVQGPIAASVEKLKPRLDRISPLAGLRNRLGGAALVGFAKSVLKAVLVASALAWLIHVRLDEIVASAALDARQAAVFMSRIALELLVIVGGIQAVLGTVDFLWQRHRHRARLRMSHRELMEELRQSEGDPHLRAARRQRAVDIATKNMLGAVPKADVVIVNPTHIAVALRWDRTAPGAPVCVAKGVGELARRIRSRAEEAGVPVRRDPPTARALYATVELGEPIRTEHYRAVAAAIRFADAVRKRAAQARRP
jgi:flagellar biosynthetic protein FlhB